VVTKSGNRFLSINHTKTKKLERVLIQSKIIPLWDGSTFSLAGLQMPLFCEPVLTYLYYAALRVTENQHFRLGIF